MRFASGEADISGEVTMLSLGNTSSTNGSFVSLSGLKLALYGAEKPPLPMEEMEESDNAEQTEAARP